MKIRTDFVTNSSSSCFCVILMLTFDNGNEIELRGYDQNGDTEGYWDCVNLEEETLNNPKWKTAAHFSDVVEAKNNIDQLKNALYGFTNTIPEEPLEGATELTKATMIVNACVNGEWTYESDPSQMLDVEINNSSTDKMKLIKSLRDQGLKCYTDEALETIIDSSEEEGSKSFIFRMDSHGKIDAEMIEGESYDSNEGWDEDGEEDDWDDDEE